MNKVTVTPFQQKVYDVVRKIPKGKTMTYAEVARAIGNPKAVRAVGTALNRNPWSYVSKICPPEFREAKVWRVPCHRVIRSGGSIGGFAWGFKEKQKLLEREGYFETR